MTFMAFMAASTSNNRILILKIKRKPEDYTDNFLGVNKIVFPSPINQTPKVDQICSDHKYRIVFWGGGLKELGIKLDV